MKKYRVLFKGLNQGEERFKRRMSRFGVPSDTIEVLLRKAPIVIKSDVTLKQARQYADAIQEAGGMVTIQEHGFFEESGHANRLDPIAHFREFTMCPECGFKQPRSEACARCGSKFLNSCND